MFVKFCGFLNPEDAELAVRLGADAIGIVFHKKSPRNASLKIAAEISKTVKGKAMVVGVFVDEDEEVIMKVSRTVGLDAVQLHGEELPSNYSKLLGSGLTVIKAVKPESVNAIELARAWSEISHFLLLDSYDPKRAGGTGKTFEKALVRVYLERFERVIVAGGINMANIDDYLNLKGIYGIDISSGIEVFPGVKSPEKMKQILMKAKRGKRK